MARYNLFPSPTHSSLFVLSLHPRNPSSILSLGLRDTKNWSRLPHYTPLIGSGELIGQTIDHMSSESIARDTPSDVTNPSNFPLEFLNFINPVKSFQRIAYWFSIRAARIHTRRAITFIKKDEGLKEFEPVTDKRHFPSVFTHESRGERETLWLQSRKTFTTT